MNLFKGENNRNKKNLNQPADSYDAPDLVAHRYDPGNLLLGLESIHLTDGHAGVKIEYYAQLHQVIVYNYGIINRKGHSSVERTPIPVGISGKNEIIAYLKKTGFSHSHILQEEEDEERTIIGVPKYQRPPVNPQIPGMIGVGRKSPPPDIKYGLKWEMNLGNRIITQYIDLGPSNRGIVIGTEIIDGPSVILDRDYYFYFYIASGIHGDKSYCVIDGDFDGPFRLCSPGTSFQFGIDTFTLL